MGMFPSVEQGNGSFSGAWTCFLQWSMDIFPSVERDTQDLLAVQKWACEFLALKANLKISESLAKRSKSASTEKRTLINNMQLIIDQIADTISINRDQNIHYNELIATKISARLMLRLLTPD